MHSPAWLLPFLLITDNTDQSKLSESPTKGRVIGLTKISWMVNRHWVESYLTNKYKTRVLHKSFQEQFWKQTFIYRCVYCKLYIFFISY